MKQNKIMNQFLSTESIIKKSLTIGLLAMTFGLFSVFSPVKTDAKKASAASHTSTQRRSWRFGPYATHRRAIEVMKYARKKGYKAKVVPAGSLIYGSRVYYVNVWR